MSDLSGKVALVTGAGKDRGMGLVTARRLAQLGAAVVLTDLCRPRSDLEIAGLVPCDDFSALQEFAQAITEQGGRAIAIAVDVSNRDEAQAAVEETVKVFGGLDILFNNAGVAVGVGPFLDIPAERWRASWDINVMGMVHMCQAALPILKARGDASIINNASLLGVTAVEGYAAYCASKHAVVGLTKSIAAEFGRDGVRCNAICPGMIMTQMGQAEVKIIADQHHVDEATAKDLMAAPAALRRCGTPEEVADVVAWLAGPNSRFITGIAIPVAGGFPLGL